MKNDEDEDEEGDACFSGMVSIEESSERKCKGKVNYKIVILWTVTTHLEKK